MKRKSLTINTFEQKKTNRAVKCRQINLAADCPIGRERTEKKEKEKQKNIFVK